jgi:hypothetical protein
MTAVVRNSLPARIATTFFIEEDMQDLHKFLKRPAIQLYFNTYKADYESAMTTVINAKESVSAGVALYLPFVLSKRTRQMVSVLRKDALDGYINSLNAIVNYIYADNPIVYTPSDVPHQNKLTAKDRALAIVSAEEDDQASRRFQEQKPSALVRAQSLPQSQHIPAGLSLFDRMRGEQKEEAPRKPHPLKPQLSDSSQQFLSELKKKHR